MKKLFKHNIMVLSLTKLTNKYLKLVILSPSARHTQQLWQKKSEIWGTPFVPGTYITGIILAKNGDFA